MNEINTRLFATSFNAAEMIIKLLFLIFDVIVINAQFIMLSMSIVRKSSKSQGILSKQIENCKIRIYILYVVQSLDRSMRDATFFFFFFFKLPTRPKGTHDAISCRIGEHHALEKQSINLVGSFQLH